MDLKLTGKNAVILGGTRGIGRSIADTLADEGVNVAICARKQDQIDAAVFDLPTALFISAVQMNEGLVLGQFPSESSQKPDQFGMLMEEGSALKACVDAALGTLKSNGALAAIEAQWLQDATSVPLVK